MWLYSSVGRALHWYSGRSRVQILLKPWIFFRVLSNCSTNMDYFIYSSQISMFVEKAVALAWIQQLFDFFYRKYYSFSHGLITVECFISKIWLILDHTIFSWKVSTPDNTPKFPQFTSSFPSLPLPPHPLPPKKIDHSNVDHELLNKWLWLLKNFLRQSCTVSGIWGQFCMCTLRWDIEN